jgi:hypothetical protein
VLAWYEAERRKRPREPSPDNHDEGERKRSDEGRPLFYYDDVAVELIINAIEQISSLVRGCRKEGVVGARASTARLEVGVRQQELRLKKVVSSD